MTTKNALSYNNSFLNRISVLIWFVLIMLLGIAVVRIGTTAMVWWRFEDPTKFEVARMYGLLIAAFLPVYVYSVIQLRRVVRMMRIKSASIRTVGVVGDVKDSDKTRAPNILLFLGRVSIAICLLVVGFNIAAVVVPTGRIGLVNGLSDDSASTTKCGAFTCTIFVSKLQTEQMAARLNQHAFNSSGSGSLVQNGLCGAGGGVGVGIASFHPVGIIGGAVLNGLMCDTADVSKAGGKYGSNLSLAAGSNDCFVMRTFKTVNASTIERPGVVAYFTSSDNPKFCK